MTIESIKYKNIKMLIAGVDEAGRGCILNDIVVACVVMDEETSKRLNIPDSKTVKTVTRREALYDKIMKSAERVIVVRYSAKEITDAQNNGFTLNEIETMMFALALENIDAQCVYLDAADVNEKRFGTIIKKRSGLKCEFVSKHKADAIYPVVGAASIITKVTRDRLLRELNLGNVGSGYPSDPVTRKWLKECNGKYPDCVRMNWSTLHKLN